MHQKLKRALDLLLIGVLIPLVVGLAAILAAYIKLVSPGSVLFRQRRVGYRQRSFEILKFRTMHQSASSGVHQQHVKSLIKSKGRMNKLDDTDSRLIPFAKWIRAFGLDELPQLLNVLKGEMSLVGPRPCTEYEFKELQEWHKERFNATPGLTGLWQVSGKNNTTFRRMILLDIHYTRNYTIWLDLYIILSTIPALIKQAYESGKRQAAEGARRLYAASTANGLCF